MQFLFSYTLIEGGKHLVILYIIECNIIYTSLKKTFNVEKYSDLKKKKVDMVKYFKFYREQLKLKIECTA